MRIYLVTLLVIGLFSCEDIRKSPSIVQESNAELKVSYASGFSIDDREDHYILTLNNPWPGADTSFTYILLKTNANGRSVEELEASYTNADAIFSVPVQSIVVTSTTHIPSLDLLGVADRLVGFPNLDYISSETTRKLISEGKIQELGQNESINTEVLIELNPDVVVGFAVDGANSTFSTIEKTGIPVIYNSDWTETHPLGKAEWIKYFGLLFGKEHLADSIFRNIERDYHRAKEVAARSDSKPTVLSGAMYRDVWYMPQGNSWAAQFIRDANGTYLWEDSEGTGSLSLSLETVLVKGKKAEYWIGPGQFVSKQQFNEAHSVYGQFDALKNDRVYSFTKRKGETGGVVYYELAPNRPDLVLKDIIAILHPELLPDHQLFFFSKVE